MTHSDGRLYDRGEAVCVIGAGAGGLVAIKNLREYGFAVDCYERETSVGGVWNWRHERSPIYASTYAISSRPLTQYPDFPLPDHWPDYPHHSQLLAYLERYADHFALREHIWFGTEVDRIDPTGDGRWDVIVRGVNGGPARALRYGAVVVATGHHWDPREPSYPGLESYAGQVIHSLSYKDAAQLRGRRVLVVGAGNSGCDIAVEAAAQANAVWHSTRRGYWYVPKYALGKPADQLAERVAALHLPWRLRQWLLMRTLRVSVGDLTRLGLPKPDHRVLESHPIVNSLLPYYLGHGAISPRPDVAHFEPRRVVFADGSSADPDLVVFATGYAPRFEFLNPDHLNVDADGRPRLYLHLFTPRHETLFALGLVQPDSGVLPLLHWQSVAVAQWLRARTGAPERARKFWRRAVTDTGRRWTRAKVVGSPRHWFEVSRDLYLRGLERNINELEGSR